jgi:hypothetical protein
VTAYGDDERRQQASALGAAEFITKPVGSGLTPLDYLVSVYRDEDQMVNVRIDAAKAVAAYCYPKLQALDLGSREGQPLTVQIIRFSDLPTSETPSGQ